jgi:hypothetical protein
MAKKYKNAILFSKIDSEDSWVCGGLVLKVKNSETYQEAYEELKSLLESEEIVNFVKEDNCLDCDLFLDETYKFKETLWEHKLKYVFRNSEGDEKTFILQADFVYLPN